MRKDCEIAVFFSIFKCKVCKLNAEIQSVSIEFTASNFEFTFVIFEFAPKALCVD